MTSRPSEVTLRSKSQQIAKHQKQLNESTGKKEYDALQAEIAADKKAMGGIEDEILNDMMETEERTAKIPELEKAVNRMEDYVRTQLGDARSFSLDSPKSRSPRIEALRKAAR